MIASAPDDGAVVFQDVSVSYSDHRRRGSNAPPALSDINFILNWQGSLGIVGESGAGKSTMAALMVGTLQPSSGEVFVGGDRPGQHRWRAAHRRSVAQKIQIVPQNSFGALDPRQTVATGLEEILRFHSRGANLPRRNEVSRLLNLVGLTDEIGKCHPAMLSGGQRQRVAIARGLAPQPRILVLDESVASLDVSIQAQILNVLSEIRAQLELTYVVISHDLAVIRHLSDDVLILRSGLVVESGPTGQVLDNPAQPYTQLLRQSVPRFGDHVEEEFHG